MRVNGKTMKSITPDDASHTFTVPQMGISVPIKGVRTTRRTSARRCRARSTRRTRPSPSRSAPASRGGIRWQCFVPCAAGFIDGFGGPDADDRLHGRLPPRGLSPSDDVRAQPLPPHPDPVGRAQRRRHARSSSWCARPDCRRATATTAASGQVADNTVLLGHRDPDRRADHRLLRLRADRLSPPRLGARRGRRDPGRQPHRGDLAGRHLGDRRSSWPPTAPSGCSPRPGRAAARAPSPIAKPSGHRAARCR